MKTTKCDACHEEKPLFFFPTFDGWFVAYCEDDAVKMGYQHPKSERGEG